MEGRRLPFSVGPELVSGIDVSNHQDRDLTSLIRTLGARHVVVKLYLGLETPPQDHSRDQLTSARANGCTAGGYFWLYATEPAADQVKDIADSFDLSAIPVLWIDVERYPADQTIPGEVHIASALDECDRLGITAGIYTSQSEWGRIGSPSTFKDRPLWTAFYSTPPEAALDTTPLYGGWTRDMCWGHQWTSTPIDRDVFRRAAS